MFTISFSLISTHSIEKLGDRLFSIHELLNDRNFSFIFKGDIGARGLAGKLGRSGDSGAPGQKGRKGSKGADGIQGLRGPNGLPGQPGDKGVQVSLTKIISIRNF